MPSLKSLRHQEIFFAKLFEELTDLRVQEPERAFEIAQKRRRRQRMAPDGKLNIIAIDHPARYVVKSGSNPLAMANRAELLMRIVRILSADCADGVMASMDILEELLVLHDLMQSKGLPRFLDDKVMVASLNRGGLIGSVWEMDDPITGPRPVDCKEWNLDGVKMLLRITPEDKGCLRTIEQCREAISESNSVQLPFFLEPLAVTRESSGFKVDKAAESQARLLGVATALGDSSRYVWLKLPYCENFDLVAKATTMPILMLGGESENTEQFLDDIKCGMSAGYNVRGAMIGRNVLFPQNLDPVDVAASVHDLVHHTHLKDTH